MPQELLIEHLSEHCFHKAMGLVELCTVHYITSPNPQQTLCIESVENEPYQVARDAKLRHADIGTPGGAKLRRAAGKSESSASCLSPASWEAAAKMAAVMAKILRFWNAFLARGDNLLSLLTILSSV